MRQSEWTDNQDAVLTQMLVAHTPYKLIAERVGHTTNACEARARNLGLQTIKRQNRWTPERDALLRSMFPTHSFAQIADALGGDLTKNACIGRAHRIGLSGNQLSRKPAKRADAGPRLPRGQLTEKTNRARRRAHSTVPLPLAEIIEAPVRQDFLGIPFMDVVGDMCRFPKGDGLDALYCGQPQKPDSSYCPACHQLCYAKAPQVSEAEHQRRLDWGAKMAQSRKRWRPS